MQEGVHIRVPRKKLNHSRADPFATVLPSNRADIAPFASVSGKGTGDPSSVRMLQSPVDFIPNKRRRRDSNGLNFSILASQSLS
jgi:hypothetical protein|eukprot:COSAG06_NODE_4084_length_4591_cov_2.794524_4_plen_84_part_00